MIANIGEKRKRPEDEAFGKDPVRYHVIQQPLPRVLIFTSMDRYARHGHFLSNTKALGKLPHLGMPVMTPNGTGFLRELHSVLIIRIVCH